MKSPREMATLFVNPHGLVPSDVSARTYRHIRVETDTYLAGFQAGMERAVDLLKNAGQTNLDGYYSRLLLEQIESEMKR